MHRLRLSPILVALLLIYAAHFSQARARDLPGVLAASATTYAPPSRPASAGDSLLQTNITLVTPFNVSSRASIFGAGNAGLPPDGCCSPTLPPFEIILPAGIGRTFSLSNVAGVTEACCDTGPDGIQLGPDGGNFYNATVNLWSFGGISGVIDNTTDGCLALMGVFTAGPPAGPAPATLDVTTLKNAPVIQPLLDQSFFIGDGLTGTGQGTQQVFIIPDEATLLFLGFADGGGFQGPPGAYSDNYGSISGTLNVSEPQIPYATITSPTNGALVVTGTPISIASTASEPSGSITTLAIYNNTSYLLAVSNAASFFFLWTNAPAGTDVLTAVATDTAGFSATSAPVVITVGSSPVIVQQPASVVANPGANINFTVVTTGSSPLTYQWFFNGSSLPVPVPAGATPYEAAVLAAEPVAYWALNETNGNTAFDLTGQFNGTYGTNSVLGQPGPSASTFPGFGSNSLAFQPGSSQSLDMAYVTVPALNVTTNTVTILMWINPSGDPIFDPEDSWTGLFTSTSGGATAGLDYNDMGMLGYQWNDGNPDTWGWDSGLVIPYNTWSLCALVVEPGQATLYLVNTNGIQASVNAIPEDLELFNAPSAIGADASFPGTRTFFGSIAQVAVFNYAMPQDQLIWLYSIAASAGPGEPGATVGWGPLLPLDNVSTANDGGYQVIVANGFGSATSVVATLTVNVPPTVGITNPVYASLLDAGAAIAIGAAVTNGTGQVTNVNFSVDAQVIGQAGAAPFAVIWTNPPAGPHTLTAVALDNNGLSSTSAPVAVTVGSPPVITQQPASVVANPGASVNFTVTATGSSPLSYQWLLNGTNLPSGSTNTADTLMGLEGELQGAAAFTTNGGGHTGQPGDYALDLGMTGSGDFLVTNASFVDLATSNDCVSVSFWLYRYDINASSAFWFISPTSSGSERGLQAHMPWSDDIVYFDTAGCCDPAGQSINAPIGGFPPYAAVGNDSWWNQWHFFVLWKNGPSDKEIWIDGQLFLRGSSTAPLPTDITQLYIGGGPVGDVDGRIDDFAVYATALGTNGVASGDIGRLYAGTRPSSLPASDGLLAYWRFDDPFNAGPALLITNATSLNSGNYQVVVANTFGSVTSAVASLTLNVPPSITQQPESFTVVSGASVTFTTTATGTIPLSYQWEFNAAAIAGSTNAALTLTNAQSVNAGVYSVVVTNIAGSVTSSNAVLTVNVPPSITQQPQSQIVTNGAVVTFTVAATGTAPLSYEWEFNGKGVAGATNDALTLNNAQQVDAAKYSVVVTNIAGSVTSSIAVLTVIVPPSIMQQPQSQTVTNGAGAAFTVAATGTAPLSYQWDFNGAVLSMATNATLTLTDVQATNGGKYSVVVTNVAGSVTSSAATLAVVLPVGPLTVAITFPTNDASFVAGSPIEITALASEPNGSIASIALYNNATNLLGGTNVASFSGLWTNAPAGAQILTAVATDAAGLSTTSAPVAIQVAPSCDPPPSGLVSWWPGNGNALDIVGGNNGTLTNGVSYVAGEVGQGFNFNANSARVLVGNPANLQLQIFTIETWIQRASTTEASSDPTSVAAGGAGVLFGYGYGGYAFAINRNGSIYLTMVGVSSVTASAGVTDTNWHHVAVTASGAAVVFYIDGVAYPAGNYSPNYEFTTAAAIGALGENINTYDNDSFLGSIDEVSIYNRALSSIEIAAIYNAGSAGKCMNEAPVIVTQPTNQTVAPGSSVTFAVSATGAAPLSYQWEFNGGAIAGATNAALSLTNVQPASSGLYSVGVTNVAGSATSSNAALTVNVPPAITQQPQNQTVTNGANVVFTVTATGASPLAYQWLFNGAALRNATNSNLTLADVQSSNGGNYGVVVTNIAGSATSSPAALTVVVSVGTIQVVVTSPTNNASFALGEGIAVAAAASEANGSIASIALYNNTTNILGATNAAALSELWTNAPVGTNILTAVAIDFSGLSATSAPVSITVTNIPPPPVNLAASIVSPGNNSTVCNGNDIVIQGLVTNGVPIASVKFYAGSTLLGSVAGQPGQSAYSFDWTQSSQVPLTIGNYVLTVVATDTQGNTATSAPAAISVAAQCAQIAIVRAAESPEIDSLQSNLTLMPLTYQVFDQAGLNASLLQGFQLIIWDDGGQTSNAPAPNTVDALAQSYSNGIPLYLIGQHLASSAALLPPAQQAEWTNLTFLSAPTGTGGGGTVQITNLNGLNNPILSANFGLVTNFDYPAGVEMATNTQAQAEVFGVSGGADVLMAYPGPDFGVADFSGANLFVQNVLTAPQAAPESGNDLQILFQNTVCWLIGGCNCPAQAFNLNYPSANITAQGGQPFTVTLFAENSGECSSTGVVVTNTLPPGAQFIGATSERGTFSYDPARNELVFYVGLLPRGVPVYLYVTMMAAQPGVLTNAASGVQNSGQNPPPAQAVITVQANPAPLLSIQMVSPSSIQLSLNGQAGVNYEIDSSTDLLNWLTYTNVAGPGWNQILPPLPTIPKNQFFRAKVTD